MTVTKTVRLAPWVHVAMMMTFGFSGASCDSARPVGPSTMTPEEPSGPAQAMSLTIDGPHTLQGRHVTSQLRAIATYEDGTTEDRTGEAAWTTSDNSVATVTGAGQVTSLAFGSARISATFDSVTGSLELSVVPVSVEFTVLSQGYAANPRSCGGVVFRKDGTTFYSGRGCVVGSARGWNVAAVDQTTGELLEPVRNFDTWYSGAPAATALIEFLGRQPHGTLLLIAVGDEAGITVGRSSGCPANPAPGSVCCRPLAGEFERLRRLLEELGARDIRSYCYWNSYSVIAIKGIGAVSEQLGKATDAVTQYTLALE